MKFQGIGQSSRQKSIARHYAGTLMNRVTWELMMWRMHILKCVPGWTGCAVRNLLLPYRNGKRVHVWDQVHIEVPERLTLGDDVGINRYSMLHAGGGITIGDHVLIGPRVIIHSQNHRFDDPELPFDRQDYIRDPIVIGNNVWLGANVIVLPGVVIGDDVIVGAGSVVTTSIDSGSMVVGNPARIVRALPRIPRRHS